MMTPLVLFLAVATEPASAAATGVVAGAPAAVWYDRDSCKQIIELVLVPDFPAADEALSTLERSKDPDDGACAAWTRMVASELKLAIYGRAPENLEDRRRRLTRLFQFSKANEAKGQRFRDLEIEARTRRVRVLADDGDRTGAISEARRVKAMLLERNGPVTPTIEFTKAVINLAISYESWAMRTILGMAGLEGDAEIGKTNALKLADGSTAYRWEATYIGRHFAHAEPTGVLGTPLRFSEAMAKRFPNNPELAGNYAKDLSAEARAKEALAFLAPHEAALSADPTKWSAHARARLWAMLAIAAKSSGDAARAKAALAKSKSESQPQFEDLYDLVED